MQIAKSLLALIVFPITLDAAASANVFTDTNRGGFEENLGQLPADVRFHARAENFELYLTASDFRVAARQPAQSNNDEPAFTMLQLAFVGATATTPPQGLTLLDRATTYIRSAEQQIQRIPTFDRVKYCDIYPSIDLEVYRTNGTVEFDFVIHPSADPATIRLDVGMASARLDGQGDLLIRGEEGVELRVRAPVLYQMVDGAAKHVDGRFRVSDDGLIGFVTDAYDRSRSLIIDPVLSYATYISGNGRDDVEAIFVDPQRNVYVTGATASPNLPMTGTPVFGTFQGGSLDAFVMKYSQAGTRLFATYLGGNGADEGLAITADTAGHVYVAGHTRPGWDSTSNTMRFPVTAGAYASHPSPGHGNDSFVTKLTPEGSSMVFSAIVAGSFDTDPVRIALDALNNVIVAGDGTSPAQGSALTPFPTTANAYRRTARKSDAFIYKLSASGADLLFATFFGGSEVDSVEAVAVDPAGNVVIGGSTSSTDLPVTSDALHSTFVGPLEPPACPTCPPILRSDGWVAKISKDGRQLLYGSYIRGGDDVDENDIDRVAALAVDPDGSLYIGGKTLSDNFPTTEGAFQTAPGVGFLVKLNAANALTYSTYLPIDVSALGVNGDAAYVAGPSGTASIPMVSPVQATNAGGGDAVLMRLNANGSALEFSTYLGGSSADTPKALVVDSNGNAYLAGHTTSTDFPTTANAAQQTHDATDIGKNNSFVAVFVLDADGDGLLDPWETGGIDVDGNGAIDLNLAALGATPDHKDLFVEVDFMSVAAAPVHTHDPRLAPGGTTLPIDPMQQVIAAFAGAPVTNPDGQTGIRLHVLMDENLPEQAIVTFRGAGSGFDGIKRGSPPDPCASGHFGTVQDRSNQNCANILRAKRLVYRYALFGHEFEDPGVSGVAELGGNDLFVTHRVRDQGGADFEQSAITRATRFSTTFEDEWSDMVAGTFMHEFGHTLGLTHGGAPAEGTINCKPNYLSVMNYTRQHNNAGHPPGSPAVIGTDRALDFSRSVLPTLDETVLSEAAGIAGPAGTRFGYGEGVSGAFRIHDAASPTDWNGQNGIESPPVAADVNFVSFLGPLCGPSSGQKLKGFNDWNGLVYSFRTSHHYGDGVASETTDMNELTDEDVVSSASVTQRPSVSVSTPVNGTRFSAGSSIAITATATDSDGVVSSVQFLGDRVVLAEDSTVPYSFTWLNPPEGTHSIKVRATDDQGAISSETIVVHVGCDTLLTSSQAIPFSATAGVLQISIGSDCSWNATSTETWLSVAPASGIGAAAIPFAAEVNATGSSRVATVVANEATVTITQDPAPPFSAPSGLAATALKDVTGRPYIALTWNPVANVNYYEVSVRYPSGTYAVTTTDRSLTISTNDACPNTAFLFKVRAISTSAQVSPYSAPELATVMYFTDDPIIAHGTIAKALHITELRSAVNAVRTLAGLASASFPTNVAVGATIVANPITELRNALDPARSALGLPILSYTDPTLAAGTLIKAVHIEEIRYGIQ